MKQMLMISMLLLLSLSLVLPLVSCTAAQTSPDDAAQTSDTALPDSTLPSEETTAEPEETLAAEVILPEIGPDTKLVAFTFDDGPSITQEIADLFAEYNGHCTFFVYGNNMSEETDPIVRNVSRMGCEFANHSTTHPVLTDMTDEEIMEELRYTSDRIETLTGKAPRFFRPPYYAYKDEMFEMTDMIFTGGEMADDWIAETTSEQIFNKMKYSYHGEIWALHEAGSTFEALKAALPYLAEKGFVFVTLSELEEYVEAPSEKLHGRIVNSMSPGSFFND